MPDETQQLIAGRYRLERSLGAGGMGQVWSAADTLLGRTVAVKVVDLRGHHDQDSLHARVMREARAAARIDDAGSVRVFDVVDEGDAVYLVMELVEAPTLAEVVQAGGPLPPDEVVRIGLDVLGALSAAHRAGIVHRDVKPNNVMVLPDGRAKLADFGIASVKDDPGITSTGMVLGTPKYMSPEQARGDVAGAPADLWGLGALLYFAVEGEPPFDRGDALPTLNAILHDQPRATQRADGLTPVLAALLAKAPEDRPSDAEARRLLEGVAASAPPPTVVTAPEPEPTVVAPTVTAAPQRPVAPPTATSSDRRWLAALAAVAAVVLVAAVLFAATQGEDDPETTAGSTTTTSAAESTTTAPTTTTTVTSTTAPADDEPSRPEGVADDWVLYRGDGWTTWYPPDWNPTAGPAGSVDFQSPSGDYLRIDTVDQPGDDPVAGWEAAERGFRTEHPDYERIRIEPTEYQGFDAAIWEFTFEGQRAANLGFSDGDTGYALNLVTDQSTWEDQGEAWEGFQAGFRPGG